MATLLNGGRGADCRGPGAACGEAHLRPLGVGQDVQRVLRGLGADSPHGANPGQLPAGGERHRGPVGRQDLAVPGDQRHWRIVTGQAATVLEKATHGVSGCERGP